MNICSGVLASFKASNAKANTRALNGHDMHDDATVQLLCGLRQCAPDSLSQHSDSSSSHDDDDVPVATKEFVAAPIVLEARTMRSRAKPDAVQYGDSLMAPLLQMRAPQQIKTTEATGTTFSASAEISTDSGADKSVASVMKCKSETSAQNDPESSQDETPVFSGKAVRVSQSADSSSTDTSIGAGLATRSRVSAPVVKTKKAVRPIVVGYASAVLPTTRSKWSTSGGHSTVSGGRALRSSAVQAVTSDIDKRSLQQPDSVLQQVKDVSHS